MTRVDRTLTELAANQHGLVTRQQALLHGLGLHQLQRRLDGGRWVRTGRGVYRLAGAPVTWKQQALAACLAAADGAVVSHLTAAAVLDLGLPPPPIPHLTVPMTRSHRVTGAIGHRARLGPTEATSYDGVPTTSPGRTLIDCAALLGPNQLRRIVDEAFHRRLVTVAAIGHAWDLARLRPGRSGEVKLRAAVEPWTTTIRPGSPAEIRLRLQLVQWGYPEPELQVPIRLDDGTVIALADMGWSFCKVGIEYDSLQFHGPSAWASDVDRQRLIESLGWTLLRADKADLNPGERSLRDALARSWAHEAA